MSVFFFKNHSTLDSVHSRKSPSLHPTVPHFQKSLHPTLPFFQKSLHPTVLCFQKSLNPTVDSAEQKIPFFFNHTTLLYLVFKSHSTLLETVQSRKSHLKGMTMEARMALQIRIPITGWFSNWTPERRKRTRNEPLQEEGARTGLLQEEKGVGARTGSL